MNNSFDWRLMRTFLAAMDKGSLLGAARELGTSQPTVGRQLSELETQLGAVLFERTGRGLRPTDVAHNLLPAAHQMAAAAREVDLQVNRASADLNGPVSLTVSQPVGCYLLPPVLMAMRQSLPGVQVVLTVTNQVSNLLNREADIALRMVRPEQASLIAKCIASVRLVACASEHYLVRRGTPTQPTDLLTHDLIGYDHDDPISRGFTAKGLPLDPARFVLRTDDMIAYWQAVRSGLGIGFVAGYVLAHDAGVKQVLPDLPLPPLPVWLTVHREVRTSGRIRAVYDFLAHNVPPELARQEATLDPT